MSEGLKALFQGDHFWHLPSDLRIEVGPTISIPLPKKYLEDTSRYSSRVRLSKTSFGVDFKQLRETRGAIVLVVDEMPIHRVSRVPEDQTN